MFAAEGEWLGDWSLEEGFEKLWMSTTPCDFAEAGEWQELSRMNPPECFKAWSLEKSRLQSG